MQPGLEWLRSGRIRQAAPHKPRARIRTAILVPVVFAVSLLMTLGIEWMQRDSLSAAWSWAVQKPALLLVNSAIIWLILLLLTMVLGSVWIAFGTGFLLVHGASLISYFKTKLRGEPFYPWDILLNKEGMNIAPLISSRESMLKLAAVITIGAALVLMHFVLPRRRLSWMTRTLLGVSCFFLLYGMSMSSPYFGSLYRKAGASEIVWDQKTNYSANGTALAFTMNMKNTRIDKPAGYGESAIAQIAKKLSADEGYSGGPTAETAVSAERPNVVFVMNEAFWDPALLPGVTFGEEPLPTIRKLQQESISGYMLTPQYGGGTSNVEYEVLTGGSMSFLPGGSVPYQQYIHQPTPSLASYFEDLGYKSMGIHPYDGWFWNRDRVYRELGFESFMSKEHFADPEQRGLFISDDEVSRAIVRQLEETDKPMFIYAVTMQNHGPYDDRRYGDPDIHVKTELTPQAQNILETYAQGARDADRSLQLLIEEVERLNEPTVVVFFGDHLPMLGMNYDVYVQSGFIPSAEVQEWTLDDVKRMYSTPFVVWSSEGLPRTGVPALSASFLGSNVMEWLGLPKPATFAFNYELSRKMPAMTGRLVVDAAQRLHAVVPEALREDVERYRAIQYDSLFGKRYLANYMDKEFLTKAALPNYNREFGGSPPQE